MSDCNRVEAAIVDYLEECLPGDERAPLEAHLTTCARCRDTVRSYRLIRESYRGAQELEVAPELAGRILAAARDERSAPRRIGRRVLLAAALAVAVLVPLALYLTRDEAPHPDRFTELVRSGDELRARDPGAAASAYREALALAGQDPRAAAVLHRLGQLCLERNEHELALSYLGELCTRFPGYEERQAALLLRAVTLAALHRDEEAVQAYLQVAAEFPGAESEVARRVRALQSAEVESLQALGYGGD